MPPCDLFVETVCIVMIDRSRTEMM